MLSCFSSHSNACRAYADIFEWLRSSLQRQVFTVVLFTIRLFVYQWLFSTEKKRGHDFQNYFIPLFVAKFGFQGRFFQVSAIHPTKCFQPQHLSWRLLWCKARKCVWRSTDFFHSHWSRRMAKSSLCGKGFESCHLKKNEAKPHKTYFCSSCYFFFRLSYRRFGGMQYWNRYCFSYYKSWGLLTSQCHNNKLVYRKISLKFELTFFFNFSYKNIILKLSWFTTLE